MKLFISFIFLALLAAPISSESVLSCKSPDGKPIFTDDPRKCGTSPIKEQTVQLQNTHNQYGALESKEYFNYANRAHTRLRGYRIAIIVETELLTRQPDLARAAADRLDQKVAQALTILPSAHRQQFKGIRYYIFSGTGSSYGGKDGGLWYFRKGNKISERFDNSILINSAQSFVNMADHLALAVTIHELAHGFNHYNWRQIDQAAKLAYSHAKQQQRYRQIKTESGKVLKQAYALENHREYFAELSAMFFAQHYYQPFNRQGLKQYDPEGYRLMETAWLQQQPQ